MSHADVTDVSRADGTDVSCADVIVSHFQGVSSPRDLASLAAEFVGNPLCYPELWPAEVSQCVCVCLRACVRACFVYVSMPVYVFGPCRSIACE